MLHKFGVQTHQLYVLNVLRIGDLIDAHCSPLYYQVLVMIGASLHLNIYGDRCYWTEVTPRLHYCMHDTQINVCAPFDRQYATIKISIGVNYVLDFCFKVDRMLTRP